MLNPAVVVGVAVLLFGSQHAAGQGASSPQLVLQGRSSPGLPSSGSAALPQTLSWPASSISTAFQGATSVTIVIESLPQTGRLTYAINWFRFFVDDVAATDGFTSYNQLNLTVTIPTTAANHTLKITKMNEAGKGEAIIRSIALNTGQFAPISQISQKRILFLGDSYTSGYGDAAANDLQACMPTASDLKPEWITLCTAVQITDVTACAEFWTNLNENSLVSYAPLAATALGADYQLVAESGAGLIGYAYSEKTLPGMSLSDYQSMEPANNLLFNRSIYSDASSAYNLTSWIPQVVVIASGSNDWNAPTNFYTLATWSVQAADFLEMISKTFNKPTIILQIFPPSVLGGMYVSAMASLYNETQRRQLTNVDFFQLADPPANASQGWCTQHPSAGAHASYAMQLAAEIGTLQTNWTTVGTIDSNPPSTVLRPNLAMYTGSSSPSASPSRNPATPSPPGSSNTAPSPGISSRPPPPGSPPPPPSSPPPPSMPNMPLPPGTFGSPPPPTLPNIFTG